MKPITLESIRNLLRSKKKNKEKGLDSSFKRSDSFKRISIRKSYLERGRKRNTRAKQQVSSSLASTSLQQSVTFEEVEHKIYQQQQQSSESKSSLQKINELLYPTKDSVDTIKRDDSNESNVPYAITTPKRRVTQICIDIKDINEIEIAQQSATSNEIEIQPPTSSTPILTTQSSSSLQQRKHQHNHELHHHSHHHNHQKDMYFQKDNNTNEKSRNSNRKNIFERPNKSNSNTTEFPSLNAANAEQLPSLVTFKTYCKPDSYIETSFDFEPNINSTRSNNSNISRTSLSYEPNSLPVIDSSTYKLNKRRGNEGIVIKIPAIMDNGDDDGDDEDDDDVKTKNVHSAKFVDGYTKNNTSFSSLQKKDFNYEEEIKREADGDVAIMKVKDEEELKKNKLRSQLSNDSALDVAHDDDDRIESGENINAQFTFEVYKALNEFSPNQISDRMSYRENNHDYFDEEDFYDKSDVISPSESLTYGGLRVKENPFTRQKEPYLLNLGRVWKQLNIGQEEPISLPLPHSSNIPNKNESFKSMSSRDSGFSVTLTKKPTKNLFRRKSKKSTNYNKTRRKPNFPVVSRDGHFKKVLIVQRNSSQRKKKSKNRRSTKSPTDLDDDLYGKWSSFNNQHSSIIYNDESNADIDLNEFEAVCNRRNKENIEFYCNKFDAVKLSDEISDLEYIYDQHLKKLKKFFDERKKMNDLTMMEICKTLDTDDYTFPHPDKRTTTNTGKKKSAPQEFRFHEVRTFSRDDNQHQYSSFQQESTQHDDDDDKLDQHNYLSSYGHNNSRDVDDDVDDIYFACKEFVEFPYSKLAPPNKLNRRSKKKPKTRRKIIDETTLERPKISLENIFPSVHSRNNRDIDNCNLCHKQRKSTRKYITHSNSHYNDDVKDDDDYQYKKYSHDRREVIHINSNSNNCLKSLDAKELREDVHCLDNHYQHTSTDNLIDDDDEDNETLEFSEHEFLAASIGDFECCEKCNLTLVECECYLKQIKTNNLKNNNDKCDNNIDNHTNKKELEENADDDDDNYYDYDDDENDDDYCECTPVPKKNVYRKKSRRKVKKYHSTLGKGYNCKLKSL